MALLREYVALEYDKNLVKEAKEQGRPVVIKKALIQRCDAPNQNNRIYSRAVLEREVEKYKQIITENRALGELDHPSDSVVNLKNVSHIMRDIWFDGDEIYGSIELLNTPSGEIARSLLDSSVKIGVSSRGIGETSVNSEGYEVVDEDGFSLITFDLVGEPSTRGAFMYENVNKGMTLKKAARIHSIISDILQK